MAILDDMAGQETQTTEGLPEDFVAHFGRLRPVLVFFDGEELKEWHVVAQKLTNIGRDNSVASLIVDSDTVSRLHAVIEYQNIDRPAEEPRCVLTDNGSRNGTFVNGERIAKPVLLKAGDRLFFGNQSAGFFLRTELEIHSDQKLRRAASIDALTGLMNRGAMAAHFEREYERAQRYGRPLSVMMIDIDDFKKINDTYGHPVGDLVLKEVAGQIDGRIRKHDAAARYGGEEFAVLLPETAQQGAIVMAERLRRSLAKTDIPFEGGTLRVSVSIGIADNAGMQKKTFEALIDRADRALLRAKAEGKNRVVGATAQDSISG